MDHAKALADALRETLARDLGGENLPYRVRAKEALAAYDARAGIGEWKPGWPAVNRQQDR